MRDVYEVLVSELGNWAARIGDVVTRHGDAVVVADPGGEIRHYVRARGDELVVTRAERSERERLRAVVRDRTDLVRFLTAALGPSVRVSEGLRLSTMSFTADASQVAPGASLERAERVDEDGVPLVAVHVSGIPRAWFPDDDYPFDAVEFSHYADQPVELIRDSFLHPTGAPLFDGGHDTFPNSE